MAKNAKNEFKAKKGHRIKQYRGIDPVEEKTLTSTLIESLKPKTRAQIREEEKGSDD